MRGTGYRGSKAKGPIKAPTSAGANQPQNIKLVEIVRAAFPSQPESNSDLITLPRAHEALNKLEAERDNNYRLYVAALRERDEWKEKYEKLSDVQRGCRCPAC